MDIKTARQYGMCAGVKRALDIVDKALRDCGNSTLYIYNEIVHNNFVINDLKQKNIVFVHDIADIPDGAVTVFSAHGVPLGVEEAAKKKNLRVFDATCLLVKKNHCAVEEAFRQNKAVVFIGKKSHPECVGTVGRVPEGYCFVVENKEDIAKIPHVSNSMISVAQTTLAMSDVAGIKAALDDKFQNIKHLGGICFATEERQRAVADLAKECDVILVAGSSASSNSCRLVQIAKENGCDSYLVDSVEDAKKIDLSLYHRVGITAGASTPQSQIDELTEFISLK